MAFQGNADSQSRPDSDCSDDGRENQVFQLGLGSYCLQEQEQDMHASRDCLTTDCHAFSNSWNFCLLCYFRRARFINREYMSIQKIRRGRPSSHGKKSTAISSIYWSDSPMSRVFVRCTCSSAVKSISRCSACMKGCLMEGDALARCSTCARRIDFVMR